MNKVSKYRYFDIVKLTSWSPNYKKKDLIEISNKINVNTIFVCISSYKNMCVLGPEFSKISGPSFFNPISGHFRNPYFFSLGSPLEQQNQ